VSYWNDLERHHGGAGLDEIWLNHPRIRAVANERISGDAAMWPAEWFARRWAPDLPLAETVVVGCGTGALERDLVRRGLVTRVTGIDLAGEPLSRARDLAVEAGLDRSIRYEQADAFAFLRARTGSLDGVFFHASLHHFDDPAAILRTAREALRPGGFVYVDEYAGPSRTQWNPLRLLAANIAYRLLPGALRRPHLIRAPINHDDPTEAPASHRIVPALREVFPSVELRGYGGNLLSLLYPNLHRPPAVERALFDRGIERLIALEDALLALPGASPWFVVGVARKPAGS
jgi:SAM-dependent methyltransferase